jgi:NADH:ubiquinone oxidoreductase subunit 3 (subunit A)
MIINNLIWYTWQIKNIGRISRSIFIIVGVFGIRIIGLKKLNAGSMEEAKLSAYECGFKPFSFYINQPFEVSYFRIGLSYIIFDLELVLFRPLINNSSIRWDINRVISVGGVIALIIIGWAWEWYGKILVFEINDS